MRRADGAAARLTGRPDRVGRPSAGPPGPARAGTRPRRPARAERGRTCRPNSPRRSGRASAPFGPPGPAHPAPGRPSSSRTARPWRSRPSRPTPSRRRLAARRPRAAGLAARRLRTAYPGRAAACRRAATAHRAGRHPSRRASPTASRPVCPTPTAPTGASGPGRLRTAAPPDRRTRLISTGTPIHHTTISRKNTGTKKKLGGAQYASQPLEKIRRRPTLPGGSPPSTIGAGGLHFRVRNGNGCFPAAIATGNLMKLWVSLQGLHSEHEQQRSQALGRLVPVG